MEGWILEKKKDILIKTALDKVEDNMSFICDLTEYTISWELKWRPNMPNVSMVLFANRER